MTNPTRDCIVIDKSSGAGKERAGKQVEFRIQKIRGHGLAQRSIDVSVLQKTLCSFLII